MKKSKIVALLALALTAVMLLSSCFGSTGIGKYLLDDATFDTNTLTSAEAVADLKKANVSDTSGNLVYLTSRVEVDGQNRTKHIVYDIAANAVVYTQTNGEKTTYTVNIGSTNYEGEDYGYFTVKTATSGDNDTTYTTSVYDAKGTQIATTDKVADVTVRFDVCYLDGKVYKLDAETAAWAYAFDYPATKKFPNIYRYSDKYYYVVGDDECGIVVYDNELNYVSSYMFPTYVDSDNIAFIILDNGNFFVQYGYTADMFSDDYTYITGSTNKFTVKSFVVNAKNGNAKEIETDYIVLDYDNYDDEDGCKDTTFVLVAEITDKQYDVSYATYATISNSGKITPIKEIEGAIVRDIIYVGQDRWVISCFAGTEFRYLVDAKGKVIGDVTGASFYGPYLTADGKIFNLNLEMLYDYKANKLEIENAFGSAIIFENKDGDLLLYTGAGDPTTLVADDSETLSYMGSIANGRLFCIKNTADAENPKYEFYNNSGAKILTINAADFANYRVEYTADDYVLVSATNKDGDTVFYRFA